MSRRPIALRSSIVVLVLLAVGLLTAPPAQAAAFRYWTYWHSPSAGWTFASDGPASAVPADGAVEGWRFAVTTQAGSSADPPGEEPAFASICGDTPAQLGRKRVGLVIDPGPGAIAPDGQTPPPVTVTCVVAPTDATGFAILQSVVNVRTQSGLICALAEYPTGECAPVLDDATAQRIDQALAQTPTAPAAVSTAAPASSTATAQDRGSPVATIAVAVLLIAGAAAWALLRRRSHQEVPRG